MNKFLGMLLVTAASLTLNVTANAHGNAKPEHGGMVKMVGETAFELVVLADKAEVYLVEESEPVATAGMTGKLSINNNGVKTETALEAVGNNKLEAKGAKIPSGAKVMVQVVHTDLSKMSAFFTIK